MTNTSIKCAGDGKNFRIKFHSHAAVKMNGFDARASLRDVHWDENSSQQDRFGPGYFFWQNQAAMQARNYGNFMPTAPIVTTEPVWAPSHAASYTNLEAGSSATTSPSRPSTPDSLTDSSAGTEERSKGGRAYEKWTDGEQFTLVQLWRDKHSRLESRHARQVWEEIAQELSKKTKRTITSTQCQRKMKHLKERYKAAKDHNRNQTGGDRKTAPFYDEIDSVLGCREIVTFSHVEESSSSTASSTGNSKGKQRKDVQDGDGDTAKEDAALDEALDTFGLNKKRPKKSQQRDDRKRAAKKRKSLPKEADHESDAVDESALFAQSIEKLQAQGDRLTGVLESMERNHSEQLKLMDRFMTTFAKAMQPEAKDN